MSRQPTILAPSILASDHADLASGVATAEEAGAKWIHVDIMDGHFVPNLTFGPQTVKALRPRTELYLDVHLMLDNPHRYVEAFAEAGSSGITIHIEPEYDVAGTLKQIRELGCAAGLAFNPDTPAEAIGPHLGEIDLALAMTVQPGFGGQSFREDVLPKIEQLAIWRAERSLNFRIEVDGGVDEHTGQHCYDAGTDTFVAGTAFFKANDRNEFLDTFVRFGG